MMRQETWERLEENWVFPQGPRSGWFQCEHPLEYRLLGTREYETWICRVCGFIPKVGMGKGGHSAYLGGR